MQKIVTNRCFGGFSISHEAVLRYAEIKGITLYPEKGDFDFWTYWTVPEDQRSAMLEGAAWHAATLEERIEANADYDKKTICNREIDRDDKVLVQVVEELGEAANGNCAKLVITEIPDDATWQIEEYDGNEHIAEHHRTW